MPISTERKASSGVIAGPRAKFAVPRRTLQLRKPRGSGEFIIDADIDDFGIDAMMAR